MMLKDFGVKIEEDEGFSQNDIFNHAPFGRRLANLLTNTSHPLTVAIDGQWGEGKTTFLKMWASQLRKDGFPVIEFDAFANDYYEDPFIPLAGEIVTLAKSKQTAKDNFADKAAKVGAALAKGGLKVAVKAITLNTIDDKIMESVSTDIADGLAGYAEKQAENLINNHFHQKGQFETFRKSLSDLPSQLSDAPRHDDGQQINPKPLIFIIDELDRCRPDYALKLLERIKHFFSAPNIHFVFGVHMLQLENSVKAMYGHDIDAKLYLEKFFSIPTILPEKDINTNRNKIMIYCFKLKDIYGINIGLEEIITFFINQKLSFRQIEKFFQELAFIWRPKRYETLNSYLAILLAIKKFKPDIYTKIIDTSITPNTASEILRQFFTHDDVSDWKKFLIGMLIEATSSETYQSIGLRPLVGKGINKHLDEQFLRWDSYVSDQ